jgi:hypothetical protein
LVLQSAWPIVLTRPPAHSWWPVDALVVASASAFLLSSAWMHARAACWRPNELVPRLWQLGHGVLCDGLIGIVGLLGILGGPESSLMRSGLWIVAPVLLAACVVSVLVTALALRDGMRRFWSDAPPENAPYGKARQIGIRSCCAAALFFSFIALDSVEPTVKPWERTVEEPPSASGGEELTSR